MLQKDGLNVFCWIKRNKRPSSLSRGCGGIDLHFVTVEYSVSLERKHLGIGIVIANLIEHEQVRKISGA